MNNRRLVDPELAALIALMPAMEFTADGVAAVREQMLVRRAAVPVPQGLPVSMETRTVEGPPGAAAVRLTVYRPTEATGARPAVYHIHGGGYVLGDSAMMEPKHRPLAVELGCVIVSVDHRLSPETAHPGPLEDCYAGLKWLHAHAAELGVDPGRIGVMGESAGGGLAAALALYARDRGEAPLAFQHLIFPMLDDRTCTRPDPHPFVGDYVWNRAQNLFGWTSLLGQAPGGEDVPHYAAPARAPDLAGLPPTFISVGALDLFLEEDMEYARRLTRAGVPVELHVYPGAYHGFSGAVEARVTRQSERDSLEALRRAMHG
ncbi:alpha/beta hydrolase [Phenylobacterium sp.]|jgi:triacylglycerol lipase|uniref:alpha/beta hydrolase n=1 Tax=Phenylobacterium sp. TaxID=1871053 RepID=UPI002F40E0E8